jgi:sugar phosphate isomerase/epimerase
VVSSILSVANAELGTPRTKDGIQMKLGVDSYSLRTQGWDAFELLEYCAGLGVENVHFSHPSNFSSLEKEYLGSLKYRADELGVTLEVGMGSIDKYAASFDSGRGTGEEQLSEILHAARVVDSPIVRCYLGSQADRLGPIPIEQHIEECLRVLKAVSPVADELGIKIALENHGLGDLTSREMLALIGEVGADRVGVCLDTGNPVYCAEDPVAVAELLAPYTVTTHIRDSRVWSVPKGAMVQWVPIGEGGVDIRRIVQLLADSAPNPPLNLEIIVDPIARLVPYFDPDADFWSMYPRALARDFARFVAFAQDGEPQPEKLPQPGLPEEETQLLERTNVQQSVIYCREVLGIDEYIGEEQ